MSQRAYTRRVLATLSLLGAIASACGRATQDASKSSTPPGDFIRAALDTTVDPGVDFFTYAEGNWLARHPIPASEASWSIGKEIQDELYLKLRTINEDAAAQRAAVGSDEQKIGDFWSTGMDTVKADRLGAGPLREAMSVIDSVSGVQGALDAAFALRPLQVSAFFRVGIYQDERHSDAMAVHLSQGGLGLPDRDFYFNAEPGVAKIRAAYVVHIARVLALLGQDSATAGSAAGKVMEFETALARASRKLEDLRDPPKNYNKLRTADVTAKLTSSIAWTDRLGAWKIRPDSVIVGQPEYFGAVNRLLSATPVPVLRDYLRVRLAVGYSPYLSRRFADEYFDFYSRTMAGAREQRPRWKRVLDAEESAMGMVLGRIFVKAYFPERSKQRYVAMVAAIRESYRERIARLDWMSDSTKAKAQLKLSTITAKVGYPDKWKDYSKLMTGTESYCLNMMNAARWEFDDMLSKYGKPVDRTEWHMTPQTYNAYYNSSNNEIVLPAGIFWIPATPDSLVDDAVAYGYAGASTIGHEITHGFDDHGRQFDAAGNMADWWTPADARKFNARTGVMVRQFDAYEPIKGIHINGKASLGENLADYGGILLALGAFEKTAPFRSGERIGGLTPVQRFFLGYALGWQSQQREEALRRALLSDVHAPAKWRVLGPLSNVPEFHTAFGVKPGQPMWRPDSMRVQVW